MTKLKFYLVPIEPDRYLTCREAQCLIMLLDKRCSRQQIADELKISLRTVDIHLGDIRKKMNCKNRATLLQKVGMCKWREWKKQLDTVMASIN